MDEEFPKTYDVGVVEATQNTDLCDDVRPCVVVAAYILARRRHLHDLDGKRISSAFTCACMHNVASWLDLVLSKLAGI